jgi:hypothetical protein
MDAPQSAQNQPVDGASIEEEQSQNAVSVDRELIPLQKAQALSKINTSPLHRCRRALVVNSASDKLLCALFIAGCFFLPWFWFTNVWLFWPYLMKKQRNATIERCALSTSRSVPCRAFARRNSNSISWHLFSQRYILNS